MKLTELFLSELDREFDRSKRALEQVPSGKQDWKPHDRSMPFGYLVDLTANILSWVGLAITLDELDIAPKDKPKYEPPALNSSAELIASLDKSVAQAREALQKTTDEHLATKWKLLAGGQVAMEQPRYEVIRDTFLHASHHRGQMTVYLRLMGAKVPALYGPSADEQGF